MTTAQQTRVIIMNQQPQQETDYATPEPGIVRGDVAKQVPIFGRIALTMGEIGACLAVAALIIILFFLTQFLGFDGLWLVARMFFLGGVAAAGRMIIFERPGGMKYGDWLLMWLDFQVKRRSGKLRYRRPPRSRATIRRAQPPQITQTQLRPSPYSVATAQDADQTRVISSGTNR